MAGKKSPTTLAGITVGDLIEDLRIYPPDAELTFSGLRFRRLKLQSEKVVQVQFQEQVFRTGDGTLMVEDVD